MDIFDFASLYKVLITDLTSPSETLKLSPLPTLNILAVFWKLNLIRYFIENCCDTGGNTVTKLDFSPSRIGAAPRNPDSPPARCWLMDFSNCGARRRTGSMEAENPTPRGGLSMVKRSYIRFRSGTSSDRPRIDRELQIWTKN